MGRSQSPCGLNTLQRTFQRQPSMTDHFSIPRNLAFELYEVLDAEGLDAAPAFRDHNR